MFHPRVLTATTTDLHIIHMNPHHNYAEFNTDPPSVPFHPLKYLHIMYAIFPVLIFDAETHRKIPLPRTSTPSD